MTLVNSFDTCGSVPQVCNRKSKGGGDSLSFPFFLIFVCLAWFAVRWMEAKVLNMLPSTGIENQGFAYLALTESCSLPGGFWATAPHALRISNLLKAHWDWVQHCMICLYQLMAAMSWTVLYNVWWSKVSCSKCIIVYLADHLPVWDSLLGPWLPSTVPW